MSANNLTYYAKDVYGSTLYYLADVDASLRWYALSGKKTISLFDMQRLTALTGVTFTQVFAPVKARG